MNRWWEFLWGGLAGVFGETLMHPVDTLKTRLQSGGPFGLAIQTQGNIGLAFKTICSKDGMRGFYRGVVPGLTGSFVTGATYFGFIEGCKDWMEENNPKINGPLLHFIAGATGDTLGSVIYVPCEVIKQRMQIQGTKTTFQSAMKMTKSPGQPYYTGLFNAGSLIFQQEGFRGLYAGYMSTLARDVPFAGLQIMFYEAFRGLVNRAHAERSMQEGAIVHKHEFTSTEELILGGAAGGISAFLCTPLDVVKTRLQVQGPNIRYNGWLHAFQTIWREEKLVGLFRGSLPRVLWYVPAAGVTFMSVELLRKKFNDSSQEHREVSKQELERGLPPSATLDLASLTTPVGSYDEQIGVVTNPVQES